MAATKRPALRRHESATLRYSLAGEFSRGAFQALLGEFSLLVAVSHFGIESRWLLWLLSSAPFIGYIGSISAAPLTHHWRKKSVVRTFELASRVLTCVAAAASTGSAFAITMAVGIAAANLASPLVSGIYGSNFRTSVRGHTVGRLHMLRMATVAATGALVGLVMDGNTEAFRPLLAGISLIALACTWYAGRVPETRRAQGNSATGNRLSDCTRILKTDRAFLHLEACWFILGISNLAITPLRVLYLRDIGFDERQIMLCTTATMFSVMVLSLDLWGRLLYRLNFAVYRIASNAFILLGILVFFRATTPATVCLGSALWALGLAGGGLSWRLVSTFFASPDRAPAYMSLHAFFCGVRGIVGPFLGFSVYGSAPMTVISTVSMSGLTVSMLLLLPLIPILRKRAADTG